AEDGIRDRNVTGVQTCALPILTVNPVPTTTTAPRTGGASSGPAVPRRRRARRRSPGEKVFTVVNVVLLSGFALMCLIPFIHVIGSSFATPGELAPRTFVLIPREWTLAAWRYVLSPPAIFL